MPGDFACFLFDNGSVRAESTRSLRRVAERLAGCLGHPVEAVSLLHSTRVPASELDGVPARLLEPALDGWFAAHPAGRALLLPFFFGPSGALTDYVPERLASLRARHPEARVALAGPLVAPDESPTELVAILADRAAGMTRSLGWRRPRVVLCDHGSPQPAVASVRDRLARELATALGDEARGVFAASMERREGEEFAFNEPLLEKILGAGGPCAEGEVVVVAQFLSPGRHAGPGGDVAGICRAAEEAADAQGRTLRTALTAPIADDERLLAVLARRAAAGRSVLERG